jgi:hypothetical protein
VERVRRDSLLAVGADRGDVDGWRTGHRHIESGPGAVVLLEWPAGNHGGIVLMENDKIR